MTVQILIALVLFGVVNYLSFRHYRRWDMTPNRDYTLSDTTVNFLQNLTDNITIVVAFVRNSEIIDDVRILVEEYKRHAKGRISVEFVDPARSPDRAEQLKNEYQFRLDRNALIIAIDDPEEQGGSTGVGTGEGAGTTGAGAGTGAGGATPATPERRIKFLSENDLASFGERQANRRRILEFHGEDALTSALIAVTERAQKKLYLVAGKGVFTRSESDEDPVTVLLDLVTRQNIKLMSLNLGDVTSIPRDADGLVLIAPQTDLTKREIAMLRDYWEGERGALFVLRDPDFSDVTTNLDAFITGYGIRPRDDRVLYSENTAAGSKVHFRVRCDFVAQDDSPIVAPLIGVTTELQGESASLALAEDADALRNEYIEVKPLLKPSQLYWGEKNYRQALPGYDGRDTKPPLAVAASAERGAVDDARIRIDSSRMVVVGNATLLNPEIRTAPNDDFVINAINWLLDREELIGIAPKQKGVHMIDIKPDERSRIFWIIAVILPAAVIFLGLFVWSTRRA